MDLLADVIAAGNALVGTISWVQSPRTSEYAQNRPPAGGCTFALVDKGVRSTSSPTDSIRLHANPPATPARRRGPPPEIAVRHLRDQAGANQSDWTRVGGGKEQKSPIMNNPFHPYRTEVAQLLFNDRDSHRPHRRSRLWNTPPRC